MSNIGLMILSVLASMTAGDEYNLSLAGTWRYRLDPTDRGIQERWFSNSFKERLQLPGSLQAQGIGDPITVDTPWIGSIQDRSWFNEERYAKYRQPGNIKIPFWLQPEQHYVGAAWYQREIDIPASWQGKRIILTLERPHWETRVWVNDSAAGVQNSLSTPHRHDLSRLLSPGKQRLTIRVDNRMIINVGPNSHSVSDHTQSNWNGIVGALELDATEPIWIDDVQVTPDLESKSIHLDIRLGNTTGKEHRGTLTTVVESLKDGHDFIGTVTEFSIESDSETLFRTSLRHHEKIQLWDEFNPALYRLQLSLDVDRGNYRQHRALTIGLREIGTEGTQFHINGRVTMLRGTLECSIFPRTGYPPTDVDGWKHVIRACKAHGLNHIRFHSWCPPEAAFTAADELGFYYHVECSTWANQGASVGAGGPFDNWLIAEADRILEEYGNHPSFVLMGHGNEPAGKNQKRFLGDLIVSWKKKDRRRLYTSGAGWPLIPESDFHSTPAPRIQQWGQGLGSRINGQPPATTADYRDFIGRHRVPVVAHEIGQWCVYPNFEEIVKYSGHLKPRNFEIFKEDLESRGLGRLARSFLLASGKLQTLCYKEEIESALRTPGYGGFQLLDLHDFPGQGTALVGILDPFWESKGYVTAAEFHRFSCETVPLARMEKRIWTRSETFRADIELAHFGPTSISRPRLQWSITDIDDSKIATGELNSDPISTGRLISIGTVELKLERLREAQRLNLEVKVDGTSYANDWDFWVYPESGETRQSAGKIRITSALDQDTMEHLKGGGAVLFMPLLASIRGDSRGHVPAGFSSIFWNTAWTRRQPPHTLGILCDPAQPALVDFPTEYHSNWQWWELVTRAHPFILDLLRDQKRAADIRPIVRLIDDWVTNRNLALVFEARVGGGKVLLCGIDLHKDLEHRPVARQLLHSLLRYMESDRFNPEVRLEDRDIHAFVQAPSLLEKQGATVRADSEARGYEATSVIDGNPSTIWHTPWEGRPPGFPHQLILDLKAPTTIKGCAVLPRQDMKNGWIKDYAVYVSNDDSSWGEPLAEGTFNADKRRKKVLFKQPVTGRYLRLLARSNFDGAVYASLAELEVLSGEK